VSLTYDWQKVDSDTLSKISFPLVSEGQLEESLNHLAEAVSGS
nr:polyketide cyclase [Nocardioidaceae bacterium]